MKIYKVATNYRSGLFVLVVNGDRTPSALGQHLATVMADGERVVQVEEWRTPKGEAAFLLDEKTEWTQGPKGIK